MQTVRIEMALANGTLANFTQASNPQLWNAAQVYLQSATLVESGRRQFLEVEQEGCLY